jgi:hypothetical protein
MLLHNELAYFPDRKNFTHHSQDSAGGEISGVLDVPLLKIPIASLRNIHANGSLKGEPLHLLLALLCMQSSYLLVIKLIF